MRHSIAQGGETTNAGEAGAYTFIGGEGSNTDGDPTGDTIAESAFRREAPTP